MIITSIWHFIIKFLEALLCHSYWSFYLKDQPPMIKLRNCVLSEQQKVKLFLNLLVLLLNTVPTTFHMPIRKEISSWIRFVIKVHIKPVPFWQEFNMTIPHCWSYRFESPKLRIGWMNIATKHNFWFSQYKQKSIKPTLEFKHLLKQKTTSENGPIYQTNQL